MGKRKVMMSEYLLPRDVILEIISRLPFKCIARCRCLSKLWASLLKLDSPYFTELFLTQSKTQPRLLFAVREKDEDWGFYSSPQPQISYKNENLKACLSVTAEFHISLPRRVWYLCISPLISGLIYCPNMPDFGNPLLCNPTTRQLFRLPPLTKAVHSFFGYDPINKHFSVLAFTFPLTSNQYLPLRCQILNLESGRLCWRSLDCTQLHFPLQDNICIDGILYYLATFGITPTPQIVACFDLNLEEFKFIPNPLSSQHMYLVNFKGKLGGINQKWVKFDNKTSKLELSLWVLEDMEKQEWSKHVYLLPKLWDRKLPPIYIVGVTATGEVVLSLTYITHPFYFYFCDIEKKILQEVEIKGFKAFKNNSVRGRVDYVENLKDLTWS